MTLAFNRAATWHVLTGEDGVRVKGLGRQPSIGFVSFIIRLRNKMWLLKLDGVNRDG